MQISEPADVARAFVEAWNDHDADALAQLFVDDADFVNVVGLWWEDREDIRRAHARGFRVMFGLSSMQLTRIKTRRLGSDAAVVHCLWSMCGQVDPRGADVGDREGVFSFVLVRNDEVGWRAVNAHNTDRIEDAETIVGGVGGATPTSYLGACPIRR